MNTLPETIHALIVGIDDYPFCPLQGCVNDALAVGAFFEQFSHSNGCKQQFRYLLAPRTKTGADPRLADAALPTRQNIIAAFDAFQQTPMKAGDVFLFHFSGHGSQETASDEFKHLKADGLNETLDCLSGAEGEKRFLLDKELAWLLWRLSDKNPEVHILVVTDCCHSGSNTRDNDDAVLVRRGKPRAEATPFESLLGIENTPENERIFAVRDGKAFYLREAKHIHLAAARDSETAKETIIEGQRRGVFSWCLLRALEQGGAGVSYLELMRRVEALVRQRVPEQIPQLEAVGGAGKSTGFLGGAFPAARPEYPVQFVAQQWRLAAGRLQGIVPGAGARPSEVRLPDGRIAAIREVHASYSVLDDAGFSAEDRDHAGLRAEIARMPAPQIAVFVDADENARRDLRETVLKTKPLYVSFEAVSGAEAEFTACLDAQRNWMLLRKDSVFPVFLRQPQAFEFVQFCDAVGKYRFVLELENANSRIDLNDLEITLETIEGQPLSLANLNTVAGKPAGRDHLTIYYKSAGGKRLQPALRCKVRLKQNTFWVGGLFLDNEFGITHNLADRELLPGQEHAFAFTLNGTEYNAIPLSVKPELQQRGVTEITDYLKIFVSTADFKLDDFEQQPLPLDHAAAKRSMGLEEGPADTSPDWAVITIPVKIVYPADAADAQALTGQDLRITPPPGFQAKYALSSLADVHRKLDETPLERGESAGLQKYLLPPASVWGDDPADPQVFSRTMELRSGADTAPSVLELVDVSGALKEPLTLELREKPAENETIVATGYDPDTGLYLPLGFTNSDGNVEVFALPPETPGQIFGDAGFGERNVKKSVKLFFRKMIRRKTENTLALVHPDLTSVAGPENIRAAVSAARNILLLTHGIFGNTEDKVAAAMQSERIRGHYDAILTYEYENLNTDLRETARDLFDQLKRSGACDGASP
ncbi:MAG: caspase family protein, partial [Saprospiraceae bacterium]|nr:caspase family protein [Saprospiraceae bacterium]